MWVNVLALLKEESVWGRSNVSRCYNYRMADMQSLTGFGTKIYGKRDVDPGDGSYIVMKWLIALFFSIIPLGSYRVIKEKQPLLTGGWSRYEMTPAPLYRRQVIYTYLVWWGAPAIMILIASLYPSGSSSLQPLAHSALVRTSTAVVRAEAVGVTATDGSRASWDAGARVRW
jgi:hypothetical protein